MSVGIARIVVLCAGNLNLPETPLRQVDVASTEVASKDLVLQTESGRQGSNSAAVVRRNIADNLDLPVVLIVTNSQVAITRNFLISLGDGGGNVVRVQVATSLCVDEANNISIAKEAGFCVLVVVGVTAVRVEEPVVVGILVVVAGNLLLVGALGICLDMGVQKTTILAVSIVPIFARKLQSLLPSVSHVLDRGARSVSNLQRTVLADFSSPQVGLEQRAHLSIAWASVGQNGKVDGEAEHIDQKWQNNQANDSGNNVGSEFDLDASQ